MGISRTTALWVVTAALLGGCVPAPETDEKLVPSFDADSLLGAIQEDGELVVAIPAGAPPLSFVSGDGDPRGLAVDVGRWIAEGLGVEASFVPAPEDEVVQMVEDGLADIAFPTTPITSTFLRETTFSNPYYLGHQRLLVTDVSPVRDVYDLAGEKVCSVLAPTEVPLEGIVPTVEIIEAGTAANCARLVKRGEVAAGTASDLALMGVVSKTEGLQITGEQLNTQGYGVVFETGASTAANFADRLLAQAKTDDRFVDWYAKWVGPYITDPLPDAPELSAEEAATLFPEETIEDG
ncbi:MAG: transporter substrate-binding domain-containing protein [Actinomycetota bacterium]|nr:transporter substrate-binding domain-containing protein [Actinomycetota bacterium]